MCLAVPVQIIQILDNHRAMVNLGGIHKEISTLFIVEPQVGDFVILHVGYALTKLDEKEAIKTLEYCAAMLEGEMVL